MIGFDYYSKKGWLGRHPEFSPPIASLIIIASVAGGLYVVWITFEDLRLTSGMIGATDALRRLVILGLACGAVAYALVEFLKRLSPLRSWFNRRSVELGFAYVAIDSERRFDRINFNARIEEITAQIAAMVRLEREASAGQSRGDDQADLERVRLEAQADANFELALDSFQSKTEADWVRLLRFLAALTASLVAGVAAMAASSSSAAAIGAFIFGLVIGGPFAWLVRDVVRLIEARARF